MRSVPCSAYPFLFCFQLGYQFFKNEKIFCLSCFYCLLDDALSSNFVFMYDNTAFLLLNYYILLLHLVKDLNISQIMSWAVFEVLNDVDSLFFFLPRKITLVKLVEKMRIFLAVKLVLMLTIPNVYFLPWKLLFQATGDALNVYDSFTVKKPSQLCFSIDQ